MPSERVAARSRRVHSPQPNGRDRAFPRRFATGTNLATTCVHKGYLLTHRALRVGYFVHVLRNKFANFHAFVEIIIAVCLGEGAFGNIRAGRALVWLEGVLVEVLFNDKMC